MKYLTGSFEPSGCKAVAVVKMRVCAGDYLGTGCLRTSEADGSSLLQPSERHLWTYLIPANYMKPQLLAET